MAKETETRTRYDDSTHDHSYYRQILQARAGQGEMPKGEEVEVVEVTAIQDGKETKIRAYADQVDAYERVLEEHRAAEADDSEEDEG